MAGPACTSLGERISLAPKALYSDWPGAAPQELVRHQGPSAESAIHSRACLVQMLSRALSASLWQSPSTAEAAVTRRRRVRRLLLSRSSVYADATFSHSTRGASPQRSSKL